MKRFHSCLLRSTAFILCILWTGCADTPESLAEELVGKIDELIDVLKTIDDKESAEDAKGDLESIVEDINDIGKRLKDLERDMTMEKRMESATKLVEEHTLDMVKAANALKMEMQRIENSSYADEIGKILQSIEIPR